MNREDGFEQTSELLREAHREPIPEAHYAAVRARVLAQLEMKRRPRCMRFWACGLAAMAVAAMLLAAYWPKHTMEQAPVVAAKQPAQPLPDGRATSRGSEGGIRAARVSKRFAVARIPRRHRAPAAAAYRVIGPPSPQPQPLVVKLITNDPNVVIYWISGE